MTQRYVEIPSSKKISDSLSDILGNDKTALSCSSGTAFPTVNLFDGMLCYRTDELKLYQLIDYQKNNQVCVGDLSGSFRHLDGGTGNAIPYSKKDLNNYQDMPTGFYYGSFMLNAPDNEIWRVLQIRDPKDTNTENASQLAFSKNTDKIYTRRNEGGVWGNQREVLTISGRGSSNSGTSSEDIETAIGLSADMLDGRHAGNESKCIPISNGEVNEDLNADTVDGYHAGHALGQIAVNDGVLNSQLNASLLNGKTQSNEIDAIPVSNGVMCRNLNAQYIGGVSVDQLVKVNSINGGASPTVDFATLTVDELTAGNMPVSVVCQLDSTVTYPKKATRIAGILIVQGYVGQNNNYDCSDYYSVLVNGSTVASIKVRNRLTQTGGAGFGRAGDQPIAVGFSAYCSITSGSTIKLVRSTAAIPFAEIEKCCVLICGSSS